MKDGGIDSPTAIRWSVVHRCELAKQDSVLEFKLRKLKFIVLVSGGHIAEALAYAKVFGQFAPQHLTGQMCVCVCVCVCSPVCMCVSKCTHVEVWFGGGVME